MYRLCPVGQSTTSFQSIAYEMSNSTANIKNDLAYMCFEKLT